MKSIAIGLISLYQRYLSPRKGFSCAYRVHTGRPSCSMLGLRSIRRHGVFAGLVLLRKRMYRCGVAFRRFEAPTPSSKVFASQRGFCDIGCDAPCDFDGADLISLCDCGSCDWPRKDKNLKKKKEATVRIPTKRNRP